MLDNDSDLFCCDTTDKRSQCASGMLLLVFFYRFQNAPFSAVLLLPEVFENCSPDAISVLIADSPIKPEQTER